MGFDQAGKSLYVFRLRVCQSIIYISWPSFDQLRFYNCVHGTAYELPCATGLVFDEAQGTCVREEQASEFAKKCEEPDEKRKYQALSTED